MLPTIYEDALAHPLLFHWFGVSQPEFEAWLMALPLRVHLDWWSSGDAPGGDLLESETILGPLVADEKRATFWHNERLSLEQGFVPQYAHLPYRA